MAAALFMGVAIVPILLWASKGFFTGLASAIAIVYLGNWIARKRNWPRH